jgi:uncharacterized protein YdiU (UPF0061 family)
MRVGYIHGVMNTDNMAISGETIDYGPCAFMDTYNPKTFFSSIDKFGRYAFSNQPPITKWNLARLAECLIPLIDKNEDKAIKIATETIDNFQNIYEKKWLNMMRDKLGLFGEDTNDFKLINKLLNWMEINHVDYTNTFCHLMKTDTANEQKFKNTGFINWLKDWESRILMNNGSKEKSITLMKKTNPNFIPRNDKVEEALKNANENNFQSLKNLLDVISKPYQNNENLKEYKKPADLNGIKYQTFCGT